MASGVVNAEADRLLESSLNGASYGLNSGTWVGLLTSAGSAATAGQEVTGGGYGRQGPVGFDVDGNTATNSQPVNFTGMPADTVTSLEFYDAVAGGNRRWYGDLTQARTVNAGDTISFAQGAISAAFQLT